MFKNKIQVFTFFIPIIFCVCTMFLIYNPLFQSDFPDPLGNSVLVSIVSIVWILFILIKTIIYFTDRLKNKETNRMYRKKYLISVFSIFLIIAFSYFFFYFKLKNI
jgi:hypothetical protein